MRAVSAAVAGIAVLSVASACSTPPRAAETRAAASMPAAALAARDESAIEISYVLGHNYYQFIVQSKESQVTAQSFLDRKVLRSGSIDPHHYDSLLHKACAFVATASQTLPG